MNPLTERLVAGKSGCALPSIGFGTWSIGGKKRDATYDCTQDSADVRTLQRALERGLVHFDTAEKYADGHAERLLGEALGCVERHQLFVTSKVGKSNMHPSKIRTACEQSLSRLGMEYLDLYLLHEGTDEVPIEELMGAMDGLVESGMVRHIGVSNFALERLKRAHAASAYGVSCNQVHYSLVVRDPESSGLLTHCQAERIPLIAYRGVEKGKMTDHPPEVLTRLATKYGKTPTQLALAWLTSQPMVGTLIFTRNPDHFTENLGAFDFTLEADDIELLRRDFPGQVNVSPSVPLS